MQKRAREVGASEGIESQAAAKRAAVSKPPERQSESETKTSGTVVVAKEPSPGDSGGVVGRVGDCNVGTINGNEKSSHNMNHNMNHNNNTNNNNNSSTATANNNANLLGRHSASFE